MKFDAADENQGVFFIAADGTATRVTFIGRNMPADLMVIVPDGLAAYFLPEKPVDSDLLVAVHGVLAQEQDLEITYQALGEAAPRQRRVEPQLFS